MTMEPETIIVVFGLNTEGRPHAARFEAAEEALATRAAQLMGYRLVKLTSADQLALAKGLPAGKIYQTGKSFAPLTKQDVYDQLAKLTPVEIPIAAPEDHPTIETETPRTAASTLGPANGRASDKSASSIAPWEAIKVGSAVIAKAPGEDSWWEAQVIGVSEQGKMLTLRWKGYEDEPDFMAPRREVALPYPAD
jgi:hypothetical protein